MTIDQIIVKPVFTEKSTQRLAQNQYTFEVHRQATKKDIKWAVEELFKVEVYAVKVVNRRGKRRRIARTRRERMTPARRFAIVTINPEQKIDIFVQQEK